MDQFLDPETDKKHQFLRFGLVRSPCDLHLVMLGYSGSSYYPRSLTYTGRTAVALGHPQDGSRQKYGDHPQGP